MANFKIEKKAAEIITLGLNFGLVDVPTGATITDVTVSISPSGGLTTFGNVNINGREVRQMVQGGTLNTEYPVTFETTISTGNKYVDTIFVKVI